MKDKFDSVRIYEDTYGFRKPYSNIEFVVTKNVLKRFINAWSKVDEDEVFANTKADDNRVVYRPQNYEQFKKYLTETKIDENLGDIKVVYFPKMYHYGEQQELGEEGYETLLALATEMLYDDSKERFEKTEKHLKRMFVCQTNKIHKEMVNENLAKQNAQKNA